MNSKSEYTKDRIIDTLIRILQKYPIDTITITYLCKEAGISRPTFYNHFKSIEDVLSDAYTRAFEDMNFPINEDENYILSNQFIKDYIHFFDMNTNLLTAIFKWDPIGYVTRQNRYDFARSVQDYSNPLIK